MNYGPDNMTQEQVCELLAVVQKTNSMMYQQNFLDQVRTRGYIVGSVNESGSVSFSASPKVHAARDEARAEAKRLARLKPGTAYIYVQLCGAVIANSITEI